ncbi:peptidoglycan-binding protein [Streptomyces sp. NBC_00654]|uniref:peptidoglycan-binding domain-containing protein n=1 Tax=Streptomyces sp. NBC_00654 TaxID=2975799 RepID=UPI002250E1BD|nr:peptidoglycan-binding domain-containing protein [Streptomyces sp. NBC_00654]MCX4969058.1 peptidoglycan-binding protein [Streptomyces sp. NBC_00654]
MTGHMCPECGRRRVGRDPVAGQAPDAPVGGPDACACGAAAPLTGEERRAARAAETAAAEDFDPLRIRPYVTLSGDGTTTDHERIGTGTGAGADDAHRYGAHRDPVHGHIAPDPADTTMPLFLDGAAGASAYGDGATYGDGGAAAYGAGAAHGAGGAAYGAGHATPYGPVGAVVGPPPGTAKGPDEAHRRTAGTGLGPDPDADPVQPRRRRPFAVLAAGAAVAAVVGAAAFAGGLFSGDDGRREALPDLTTSTPDGMGDGPADSASESAAASPSPSRSAQASPSASASGSASPSKSAEPTGSASASASPTATGPSPSASGRKPPGTPSAAPPVQSPGPTLRPGDHGPEVAELQNRLKEVWLYQGPSDADYTGRVEDAVRVYQSYKAIQGDPAGVYGPNTRRALEAETSGRGGH